MTPMIDAVVMMVIIATTIRSSVRVKPLFEDFKDPNDI